MLIQTRPPLSTPARPGLLSARVALLVACTALLAALTLPHTVQAADAMPQEVVEAHFKAILAEDFKGADEYFTRAFRDAFGKELTRLNEYYIVRGMQLKGGYTFKEAVELGDTGKSTAVVVVEFGDPSEINPVLITERMYYYLSREKAKGFGVGRDGQAWRIDIFDALRYDTLAAARRRPYLYTQQAWPEDAGRELRSRQGLFRLQLALTAYRDEHGSYPLQLAGGQDNSDPLLAGPYIDAYPLNGFGERPMQHAVLDQRSPGDFAYYPVDAEGDGAAENYWLLLHGADSGGFYFLEHDIVHILSSLDGTQQELAYNFAGWWQARGGATVTPTTAILPRAALVRGYALGGQDPPDAQDSRRIWAAASARLAGYTIRQGWRRITGQPDSAVAARVPETAAGPPLRVYSYGL